MHWKLKALALRAMPRPIYEWKQRRNGRIQVNDSLLKLHERHAKHVWPGFRAVEIGAGANLLSALVIAKAGAEVHTFDVLRWATIETVNDTARQLGMAAVRDFDELARVHRVHYHAPHDFRRSGLEAGSVNLVCSTDTLEHIPPEALAELFAESRRVAAPGCVMSHIVDYRDHYFDTGTATIFNFYRFSEAEWQKWNPPQHYVNRLRHGDILELLKPWAAEAVTVETDVVEPVHAHFARYSQADLRTWRGYITARQ